MEGLKLFGNPASTEVARVLTCLIEKDLFFKDIIRVEKLTRKPKVPALRMLEDVRGQVILYDREKELTNSREICRYLCDKYPEGGAKLYGTDGGDSEDIYSHLPPDVMEGFMKSPKVRDDETNKLEKDLIESWLLVEESYFNPPASELVLYLAIAPELGIKPDDSRVQRSEQQFSNVLDMYDRRLKLHRFLAGNQFTLADLFHLPNLHYLYNMTGRRDIFAGKEYVKKWMNMILARPSWREVVEMQNMKPLSHDVSIGDDPLE